MDADVNVIMTRRRLEFTPLHPEKTVIDQHSLLRPCQRPNQSP
jgi:hypothetical protein